MDALPKTYHHPIGPAAPRGIGCISIGPTLSRRLKRASNQARIRFIAGPHAFADSSRVFCNVGRWGAWISSCPARTRQTQWNRPRVGGPEARSPFS